MFARRPDSNHRRTEDRFLRGVAGLSVLGALLGACGVPTDPEVRPLNASDLKDLTATTTTTTTTTMPATTTTIRATTTSSVSTIPTSTTIPISITLYFVSGDRLVRVDRTVDTQPTASDLAVLLAIGPYYNEPSARTAVEPSGIENISVDGGIATIDLAESFRDLPPSERRRAVSQLVMTVSALRGVGPIRFRINGQPISVQRGDGSLGGKTVSADDYIDLVDDPLQSTSSTKDPGKSTTTAS